MVKEIYESIKVDVRDKSRNPFIGAFILVWTIRNWEAVYSFFAFDKGLSREERIAILKSYFTGYDVWEVFVTIGFALLAIIVSYSLLNITRAIVNLFEKRITPKILEATGFNDVVPIDDYNSIVQSNVELERKLNEIKEDRAKLRIEVEGLEKRIQTRNIDTVEDKLAEAVAEDNNEKPDKEYDGIFNGNSNKLSKARKIVDNFTDTEVKSFYEIATNISFLNPIWIEDADVKKFAMIGLIKFLDRLPGDQSKGIFQLTPLGTSVIDFINDNKLINKP